MGTVSPCPDCDIYDAIQLDNGNIVLLEKKEDFKSGGLRLFSPKLTGPGEYSFTKLKSHPLNNKRERHVLFDGKSVFLVKTSNGFVVGLDFDGFKKNGYVGNNELRLDYFDNNGSLQRSVTVKY